MGFPHKPTQPRKLWVVVPRPSARSASSSRKPAKPAKPVQPARPRSASVAEADAPKLLLSVDEAAACFGVGRSLMYHLINDGEVASLMVRHQRKVPVAALEAYIERRCAEAGLSMSERMSERMCEV
jgi:excisionase family DNA binding protein